VPGGDNPRDTDEVEQASSKLNEGLKSCRSMLNDYRAVIGGEQDLSDNDNLPGEGSGGDDGKTG
jgi:hypothetical protein